MNRIQTAFLFSLLLALSACVGRDYYQQSMAGDSTRIDFSQSNVVCPTGDCICMVCGTTAPPEPYSIFYNFSYAGKTCSFQPCTQEQYLQKVNPNPSGEYMNFFMLGQGGFGDFGTANTFCNNSLRMPVKWLDARNSPDGEYPLPDPGRATCFLEKGSIPVYILYSEGNAVNVDRAEEIAALFRDRGPVIITTEMGFDLSSNIAAITEQAERMKAACPNCLIALATKLGDDSENFHQLAEDAAQHIDLFAFGIDSRSSNSCNPSALYYEAVSYSERLLYKYKKPSILAYVLIDKGWNDENTCFWSEPMVDEAYSDFYTYAPAFPSSGIIGVSLYSLSGAGPLNCEDCGLLGPLGDPTTSHAAWFSQCQRAYSSKAIIPLVFTNAPGTMCMFGPSAYNYAGTSFYTQYHPPGEAATAAPAFYRCDACTVLKRPVSVGKSISISTPGEYVCKDYPVLDSYADIRDLDPAFVRATVWHESNFKRCSVGHSTAPCGKKTAIYSVTDPDSGCEGDPDWRGSNTYTVPSGHVCDMGLIPTFVPPESMWAGIEFNSDGLSDMHIAEQCAEDDDFNPFNPTHIACEGTAELAEHMRKASIWVKGNEDKLGLTKIKRTYGEEEYENAKGLIIIMMARMQFIGSEAYGKRDVLAEKFSEFSNVDCDKAGDSECCSNGRVLSSTCCGNNDFIEFVTNEECTRLAGINFGRVQAPVTNMRAFLGKYLGVREKCGICDGKLWEDNLEAWASSSP